MAKLSVRPDDKQASSNTNALDWKGLAALTKMLPEFEVQLAPQHLRAKVGPR